MPEQPFLVIWNPSAGTAARAEELRSQLRACRDAELRETSSGDEARQLARSAAANGFQRVIAAGGDGTVNAVINGLYESDAQVDLGVLPLGTGNDLCRTLGIPLDPLEAAKLVTNGSHAPRMIDLVRAESETATTVFANISSGGNSQRVPDCLTDEMKQSWGAWSYLRGAVEVLRDLTGFKTRVSFDGRPEQSMNLWNVVVANGRTVAGGVAVAPRADLGDGLLDIILIRDGTPMDVAALSTKLLLGDYLEDDRVEFQRARQVTFHSDPPMPFIADGENLGTTPISFTIVPHALNVFAGTLLSSGAG